MKLSKSLLDVRTSISVMELYIDLEKIGEYEGKKILEQLEKLKKIIKEDIIDSFEIVFSNTMDDLGYDNWYDLADSEEFEKVRERCLKLANYDFELFDKWEKDMMRDI